MPNTSPLKIRLAMIQITKSVKGSKIDSLRLREVESPVDDVKINSIVENYPIF
jgi:hypothetical protein